MAKGTLLILLINLNLILFFKESVEQLLIEEPKTLKKLLN